MSVNFINGSGGLINLAYNGIGQSMSMFSYAPLPFSWTVTNIQNNYQSAAGTGLDLSTSFTPPNNSLLCVICYVTKDGSTTPAQRAGYTMSGGSLSWTRRWISDSTVTAVSESVFSLWTAPVTTGASMIATINSNMASDGLRSPSHIFALTGPTTFGFGTAVTNENFYSTGAKSLTLSAEPPVTSIVIGSRVYQDNGSSEPQATEGVGWTEIYDKVSAPFYGHLQSQYKANPGTWHVPWQDVDSLDRGLANVYYCRGAAIEITGSV